MNNLSVIGRCGKDAEHRFTPNGKAVLSWSLAVDSGYGDAKQTLWIDCALWGERFGKLAEYIKKGSQIGVVGELGTREHEGKTYLKLNVRDVTLCGGKENAGAGSARAPQQPKRQTPPTKEEAAIDEDEIPFITRDGIK